MKFFVLLFSLLFSAVSPEQGTAPRKVDQKKWEEFKKMSPEQKERLRRLWKEFKDRSPEEQARILDNADRIRKMNPEERARLRKRMDHLTDHGKKPIDGMLDKHGIPPFLRPKFIESVRRQYPGDAVRRLKELPPEARKEEFRKVIMKFKHDTIAVALKRNLIPKHRQEEFHRLPFPEKWRITIEAMKNLHGKKRPR